MAQRGGRAARGGGGVMLAAPAAVSSPAPARQTTQGGLFTIVHRDGKVELQLRRDQLDKDYLETITTGSGLGGYVVWGDTDYLPAEIVRFEERGNQIVIVWPNWYAVAPNDRSAKLADSYNFPNSVVGIGNIVAQDANTVTFDASSLLTDQMDLRNFITTALPQAASYRLDPSLSYFDSTKAFPENDVITVMQTWVTDAEHVIDTAPDARRVSIKVVYNFAQLPDDDYRPRLADDRVGIYDDIYLNFADDLHRTRLLRYIVRWNFDPAHPGRPSVARHPMVFILSNTIPPQYRGAIRDAILEWNKAFQKIGILDAVQVKPQPDDPNFDPDDIRYNVIRWITEAQVSFGADSQTLFDPRTGEEFRTGVLVSAEEGRGPRLEWRYLVDPVRYGRSTDPVPASFIHNSIFAALLHETGHNMGLQHNFIGSDAYTAADLQSMAFTKKYGVTTSAMEYAPINLWPQPYKNGTYFQTTLGPYDYYAIHYGYAYIPGARTPAQEAPTLHKWAQVWSDPLYRYASDEDVAWYNGHAADPRVEQGDLTNDTLAWCGVQLRMYGNLMRSLNAREPHLGEGYDDATQAFRRLFGSYANCATMPAHWLGGQYLSRAHRGDPHEQPPIVPVPLSQERRAFGMLDRDLFSDAPWRFSPSLLNKLGYAEWSGYGFVSWPGYGNLPTWAYNPPARHDFPLAQQVNRVQMAAIDYLFQPLVLQRIDDNPAKATSPTMHMSDLFTWLQRSIYGGLRSSGAARSAIGGVSPIRRNLQISYAQKLVTIANSPPKGTPADASAFARFELRALHGTASSLLRSRSLNGIARAHLESLQHISAHAQ